MNCKTSFLKIKKLELYCKYTDDDEEYETRQFLGNYYLDYWERKDDNITSFKFISYLGALDKIIYKRAVFHTSLFFGG